MRLARAPQRCDHVRHRLAGLAPSALRAGGEAVAVSVQIGHTFGDVALDAGPGVAVTDVRRTSPTEVRATLRAAGDAARGPRDVRLTTLADGASTTCTGCLTVEAVPAANPGPGDPPGGAPGGTDPGPGPSGPSVPPAPNLPPQPVLGPAVTDPQPRIGQVRKPSVIGRRGLRRGLRVTIDPGLAGPPEHQAHGQRAVARRLGLRPTGRRTTVARLTRSVTGRTTVRVAPSARRPPSPGAGPSWRDRPGDDPPRGHPAEWRHDPA